MSDFYSNTKTSQKTDASQNRIIFHVDVNNAYLSWEAVYRLQVLKETEDLRLIPSAVGGDRENRHGIILAKSMPAKAFGIRTAQTIQEALNLCPELKLVPPRRSLYSESSRAFFRILYSYTDQVEKCSIDEAFMDVTDVVGQAFPRAVALAHTIKDRVYRELGFTVNVGISNARILAKMASDFKKPNRVHTLFPNEIPLKMWPLPVRELFSVGKATEKKLHNLGIVTIGDLAKANVNVLSNHLGKYGKMIHRFANGIDDSPVCPENPDNKEYSNSTTTSHDIEDIEEAKKIILSLCETVAERLRKDDFRATVVSVAIRNCYLGNSSHQMTLPSSTNSASELYIYSCRLLEELWDGTPLRLFGVHAAGLTKESFRQMDLFHMDQMIRQEKMEKVVDQIRNKFGAGAVKRASFLDAPARQKE